MGNAYDEAYQQSLNDPDTFWAKAAALRKRTTAAARGKARGIYSAYIWRGRIVEVGELWFGFGQPR